MTTPHEELRERVARALALRTIGSVSNADLAKHADQWERIKQMADAALRIALEAAAGVADNLAFANPPMSSHAQAWRIASDIRVLKGDK